MAGVPGENANSRGDCHLKSLSWNLVRQSKKKIGLVRNANKDLIRAAGLMGACGEAVNPGWQKQSIV